MQNRASSDNQKLLLIKASAGSGKTHRLTGEYLRLLFSSENHYKHILAVTFTNKATEEMKSRIVKELHTLSTGKKSDYTDKLTLTFGMSETQVRQKAGSILQSILHDYSSFSVSTIDSFFQQTMRAFTREMGLAGSYNIELDQDSVLLEIIDLMLSELDKRENKDLADWLQTFMREKMEDGKSWAINNDIRKLAKEIFNEKFKQLSPEDKDRIKDKAYLEKYKKSLVVIVRNFENELKKIGEKGVNLMDRNGLHYSDFKGGSRSTFSHFATWANGYVKEPTATFLKLPDNTGEWYTKSTPAATASAIETAYAHGLNDAVKEALHLFHNSLHYNSAKSILKNYNTLGILSDVQNRLQEYQRENNLLFLSDTTALLNRVIGANDAPFVYEKTGTRIANYMIDEFQDTSDMQWQNFRPLVAESLSHGNFNLIVGDVKQSIYRWRNSDWRLLEEQIPEDFGAPLIRDEVLETNWRSDVQVVRFNNLAFSAAADILQNEFNNAVNEAQANEAFGNYSAQKIVKAYAEANQLTPPEKDDSKGYVKIAFLPNEKDDDWQQESLDRLPREIESLQEQGFALKDIAILVRKNDEAALVARKLMQCKQENSSSPYRYDIISNDSLVISGAQSVKSVISLMRHFQNRKDETRKMLAVYEFYRFHLNLPPDKALQHYFGKPDADFPDEIKPRLQQLSTLPLYEMTEKFFSLSNKELNAKERAYMQAFLDIVQKFSARSSSNLNYFLEWWDESGYKKTLFSSETQDAIRLITVHKSKGLGFGAVIMPFTDWDIDNSRNDSIIWCQPTVEPFNDLGIVPLTYGKSLVNTIFREQYLSEKLFTYIDNLNLLYVSFTRAKNRLVVFAPKPSAKAIKDEKDAQQVSALLWKSVSENENMKLSETDTETFFEMGNPNRVEAETKKEHAAPVKMDSWAFIPYEDRLKLRLNSIGFFSDDGSRDYGKLMHDLISRVNTAADLEQAVMKKMLEGEISEEQKTEILSRLRQTLSLPEVTDWYSGKYEVINETQLLHPASGVSRPDRVMIDGNGAVIVVDYKFGEGEDVRYNRQVQRYVRQIREMGYPNVQGFVFYVKLNKVISV